MKGKIRKALGTAAGICIITILLTAKPMSLLKVTSGSMEPALTKGSLCLVDRLFNMDRVCIGDIVVFSLWDGTLAAHRVMEIYPYGLVTKGDANEENDLFAVTSDNFYGKVMFSF